MVNIAFLQETANQNIGIMYLSAILKENGHTCELFIEPFEKNFIESVKAFKPDVIGISVITGSHHWALDISKKMKKFIKNVIIILGGPHPTYFPDIIKKPQIDVIAIGEAEISFPNMIERIASKTSYKDVEGLYVKVGKKIYRNPVAPLVEDISSLPQPDHSLYLKYDFFKKHTEVVLTTTRGCPYRCSFCYNHIKARLYQGKGKFVRIRKVDDIISELQKAKTEYPNMSTVILYDDIIGVNKEWTKEFCDKYAQEINLPWFTSIRADFVTPDLLKSLAKANCFCLSIGVETGDEELRKKILNKNIPDSTYIQAARLIHKAGITVRTSNMLFLPGEDIKKAFKTIDLNRKMKTDFAWAYTLQPYPCTDIYEYSVKEGYLSPKFTFDNIDPLGLSQPVIKTKDQKKIWVLHRFFCLAVNYKIVRQLLNVLIYIPPNPLFDAIYNFSLVHSYARYHQVSFFSALSIAYSNYKELKKSKKYV